MQIEHEHRKPPQATASKGTTFTMVSPEEKKYRMVALDLDGTLLNSKHELTDATAAYLRRLHDKGIIVAIATGRYVQR